MIWVNIIALALLWLILKVALSKLRRLSSEVHGLAAEILKVTSSNGLASRTAAAGSALVPSDSSPTGQPADEEISLEPGPLSGWNLVRDVEGLHVYTRFKSDTEFNFRCVAVVDTGIAELVCIPREIDLAHTWNKFAGEARILELHSAANLDAYATIAIPWPMPSVACVFNAVLHHPSPGERAYAIIAKAIERAIPPSSKSAALRRLPIKPSLLHLTPVPHAAGKGPRTKLDIEVSIDLSQIIPLSQFTPLWFINTALWLMLPWVWGAALELLRRIADPATPLGARLADDPTGIYADIRQGSQQAPARAEMHGSSPPPAAIARTQSMPMGSDEGINSPPPPRKALSAVPER